MVDSLLNLLRKLAPSAVAFSGGVDSSLLAKGALLASEKYGTLPPIGIFAISPTLSQSDIKIAWQTAREIGIELFEIDTSAELALPAFQKNARDRCYHCKRFRFSAMQEMIRRWEGEGQPHRTLLDGENADDRSLHRPGERAAAELGVRSPLAELGLTKADVRKLSHHLALSIANRPSTPCLATRILYGLTPTPELLRRVEAAEEFLLSKGFPVCRVRADSPLTARIEVPAEEISRVIQPDIKEAIVEEFLRLGFGAVSVDLEGFVSGKMDRVKSEQEKP
ncbi:MAG: ATP-dependent sacrificial sulfur transferase LarE [Thermoguttaceae bacterium]